MTAEIPAPKAPAPVMPGARDWAPSPPGADRGQGTAAAVVRELTEADLPGVVRLCGEALHLPEDAAEAAHLVHRLSVGWAAKAGGGVSGWAAKAGGGVSGWAAKAGGGVSGWAAKAGGGVSVALVAAGDEGAVVGVVFASLSYRDPALGHIDLVAVDPRLRRRGIGRALLVAAEAALAAAGAGAVLIAGNLPYAWPGIDVRYTPAVCTALALGYQQESTAWNMTVDLSTPDAPGLLDTGPAERRLADRGVAVRPATRADVPALTAFIRATFSAGWAWEVEQSIGRDGAGCHLAAGEDGQILGFAAYGALRPSWFGPMGTAPGTRGSGIGGVLLRRCLADQRAAGHARAQIGWVGPVPFYSRTVGAYIERVFFLYRKDL